MDIFKGENFLEFTEQFSTDEICKAYLADIKWSNGFVCSKCGNKKASIRTDHKRTCTICKHNESASTNTAFRITFEMVNSSKSISSSQVALRYGISRKTAWLFMHKIRKVMKSSEEHPMGGNVQVDEFTIGGAEKGKQGRSYDTKKKKIVASVELTENRKY